MKMLKLANLNCYFQNILLLLLSTLYQAISEEGRDVAVICGTDLVPF
jgi:hypothetical protein